MFAPIRPSPMKPRCMALRLRSMCSSGERAPDRALQDGEVVPEIVAQVDLHDGSIMRPQGLAVTPRLGVDEPPERVWPARDRAIDRMVRGELQEHAGRWTALVQLPGRMQEARAVAGGGRATGRRER